MALICEILNQYDALHPERANFADLLFLLSPSTPCLACAAMMIACVDFDMTWGGHKYIQNTYLLQDMPSRTSKRDWFISVARKSIKLFPEKLKLPEQSVWGDWQSWEVFVNCLGPTRWAGTEGGRPSLAREEDRCFLHIVEMAFSSLFLWRLMFSRLFILRDLWNI